MRKWIIYLFLCLATPALSHSWYEGECCSEKDCFPLPVDSVELIEVNGQGAYKLEDGTVILEKDARDSKDGQYHVCRTIDEYKGIGGPVIHPIDKKPCFYRPPPGS